MRPLPWYRGRAGHANPGPALDPRSNDGISFGFGIPVGTYPRVGGSLRQAAAPHWKTYSRLRRRFHIYRQHVPGGKKILLDNSRVYVRFLSFVSGRVHPDR